VAGTLAGLLGVGGGLVVIPVLVILFSVPDTVAKGTSLLVIIPTALAGTLENRRHGNVDLRTAAVVGGAGGLAALGGSRLAHAMSPTVSSVLFGILLVLAGLRTIAPKPVGEERPQASGGT
jgi:hypothetical protein